MRRLIPLLLTMMLLPLIVSGCKLLDRRVPRATPIATSITMEPETEQEIAQEVAPTPTPDIDMLERSLHDEEWPYRLEAARSLPDRGDIPVKQRVDLLVGALEGELEIADESMPDQAYLPVSGVRRLQYTRALGELGDDAVSALRQIVAETEGEVRDHAILALGYLGQRDVIPDLITLLRESESVVIRMDAARVLGALDAKEAIPDLIAALEDDYLAYGRDSLGEYTIYPVRDQAAGALGAMGIEVEITDDDTYTVRRP